MKKFTILVLIFLFAFLFIFYRIGNAQYTIKLDMYLPVTPTLNPSSIPPTSAPSNTPKPTKASNPTPTSPPKTDDPCSYKWSENENLDFGWAKFSIMEFLGQIGPYPSPTPNSEQVKEAEKQAMEFHDRVSMLLYNSSHLYTKGISRLALMQGFGLEGEDELYATMKDLSCEEKSDKIASYLISPLFFYTEKPISISMNLPYSAIIHHRYQGEKNKDGISMQFGVDTSGTIYFPNHETARYISYDNSDISEVDRPNEGRIISFDNLDRDLYQLAEDVGLNSKEKDVFVEYFKDKLPQATYYIATLSDYDSAKKVMPWNIEPKPDSEIRLLFLFQPLLEKPVIKEQKFKHFQRNGFTALDFAGIVLY